MIMTGVSKVNGPFNKRESIEQNRKKSNFIQKIEIDKIYSCPTIAKAQYFPNLLSSEFSKLNQTQQRLVNFK